MIKKNIYSRITESIVNAYHDTNLDSAMEDGHEMENMGKKIVAIITADPDSDLDWTSEYEPFGATELTDDEDEGIVTVDDVESEHELCPSCGYDVDCDDDECDDDECEDDDLEDMDVKEILIDILDELRDEDSEGEEIEENEMFGPYVDEESDDEDEIEDDEDADEMLAAQDDWASEESDDEEDDSEEEYDDEEDFEEPADDEDMDEILSAPQC